MSKLSYEDYTSDFRNIDSSERNLHVAIEGLLDIGSFIISALNLKAPKTYRDVGEILLESNLVSHKVGELLIELAKFRNILVHVYAELRTEKIYELLTENFSDLKIVLVGLLELINEKNIDP